MEKKILKQKILYMIQRIEMSEDFIKSQTSDYKIEELTAREILRLLQETKEIGLNE